MVSRMDRPWKIDTDSPVFDKFMADTEQIARSSHDWVWHGDLFARLDDLEIDGPPETALRGRFGTTQDAPIAVYSCPYRPWGYGGKDAEIWFAVNRERIMLLLTYYDGIYNIKSDQALWNFVESRAREAYGMPAGMLFPVPG